MPSVFQLGLLTLGSFAFAFGQLQTLSIIPSGVIESIPTALGSSSSSSSSPRLSSFSTSSSLSSRFSTTLHSTPTPTSDNPLLLTTRFTQPSGCSGGMTQVASWSTELWQNVVNPVPTLTLSSCYPSQFYYSAVATTTLPPYTELVCPLDWETYPITDTYIVCCPSGYGIYLPNYHSTERPGLGAICTSSVWPDELIDITSYDSTGLATIIPTSADDNGTLVFATGFEGTAAPSIANSTSTPTSTLTSTSTSTSTSAPIAGTSTSSAFATSASITSTFVAVILGTFLSATSLLLNSITYP